MTETTGEAPPRYRAWWAGEAPAVPTRIKGARVIAAVKLPTKPGQAAHQWVCVIQTGSSFAYTRVAFNGKDATPQLMEPNMDYPAALRRMFQTATATELWE